MRAPVRVPLPDLNEGSKYDARYTPTQGAGDCKGEAGVAADALLLMGKLPGTVATEYCSLEESFSNSPPSSCPKHGPGAGHGFGSAVAVVVTAGPRSKQVNC